MFWRKKKAPKPVAKLIEDQCIGGQSVLYRLFRESLDVEDQKIHRMELTYFELTVMAGAYLVYASDDNKEKHMDAATIAVISRSLKSQNPEPSFETVISKYQERYQEHQRLIPQLFDERKSPDPAITLLLHLYERVTREIAAGKMIHIAGASGILSQLVIDHIDFVRKRINSR